MTQQEFDEVHAILRSPPEKLALTSGEVPPGWQKITHSATSKTYFTYVGQLHIVPYHVQHIG